MPVADLVEAIVSATGLEMAEAKVLIRVIMETSPKATFGGAYVDGMQVHQQQFAKIAGVLRTYGYVVSLE